MPQNNILPYAHDLLCVSLTHRLFVCQSDTQPFCDAQSVRQNHRYIDRQFVQFSKGIGGCIGPIVAGFILQATESSAACFYFAASATLAAGITLSFYAVETGKEKSEDNRGESETAC